MPKISGCTIVRNALKLNYPFEASILSYLPICQEVIVAYDPDSDDQTEELVKSLARKYPAIQPLPSKWNMHNHTQGSELTIQSNVAISACSSDWILYIQADEAIHEGDHADIQRLLNDDSIAGAVFERRSFLHTLDREIQAYFAPGLLRLFRNSEGFAIGDAMNCRLVQSAKGSIIERGWRMYNYSRMGSPDEILFRSRTRDSFYHATSQAIEENQKDELKQATSSFDPLAHPSSIQRIYGNSKQLAPSHSTPKHDLKTRVLPPSPEVRQAYPISLAVLLGKGEMDLIFPFLWQFREWKGSIVVLDDTSDAIESNYFGSIIGNLNPDCLNRLSCVQHSLNGDFGAARNRAHSIANSEWVLHVDLDERWSESFLGNAHQLIAQLNRDKKSVCGFPRLNLLDGVVVNDLPSTSWTSQHLESSQELKYWPPRNRDIQFRLLRKEERWTGHLHEHPMSIDTNPECVVALTDNWIVHAKTLVRQQRQDLGYRKLGQKDGMPQPIRIPAEEDNAPLRDNVLQEAMNCFPRRRLTIVETGTARDPRPEARLSDGWSTYTFASLLAARGVSGCVLYSIDLSPQSLETSRAIVPSHLHKWVNWICSDSLEAIAKLSPPIDLLYLDSSDDPSLILEEFKRALPKLSPDALVIVDDTGPYFAGPQGKGTAVIPFAESTGWKIQHRSKGQSRMTLITRPH